MGAIIREVRKDSPAYGLISPGERLLKINGHEISDVLDYMYHSAARRLTVTLDGGRSVAIRKDEYEDLGLEFDTYLMDGQRGCANKCVFCFIDQLPKGLRRTLYFKDDDARMSFLRGNYITLTNLSERDIQRIVDLRVSPLGVSVHAADPELRVRMMGNPRAGECLSILKRFAQARITMNCQIVLCPGINDGEALDRTLRDLCGLYPQANSVSVVPVGLTKHRQGLCSLTPFDRESAGRTIDQVENLGKRMLAERGSRVVYLADEFYLKAKRPIPAEEYYEDFPQLENGVGMLALFEAEFRGALVDVEPSESPRRVTVATGTAAAVFLRGLSQELMDRRPGLQCRVVAVENELFGPEVTVAGLLSGGDLMREFAGRDPGDELLIPACCLRYERDLFLDDVSLSELRRAVPAPVTPVENNASDFINAVLGVEQGCCRL